MPSKASIFFATSVGCIGAIVACTQRDPTVIHGVADGGADPSSVEDASSVDEADGVDDASVDVGLASTSPPRPSFTADGYSRACKDDWDCTAVEVGGCWRCCSFVPIALTELGRARQANADLQAACGGFSGCTTVCSPPTTHCCGGTCLARSGPPLPPGTIASCPSLAPTCPGAIRKDGGSSSPQPDPGESTSCAAQVVRTGFEDGLDPSWPTTRPSAFSIDRNAPLAGGASLRITYASQTEGYLTIAQPGACAVRMAFTLRTNLPSEGLPLARITTGSSSWLSVNLGGCGLTMTPERMDNGVLHLGGNGLAWPLPRDTDVRVVLTVDTRTKTFAAVVAPVGEPFPTPRIVPFERRPTESVSIAIDLGAVSGGYGSLGSGTVWLDDLVID